MSDLSALQTMLDENLDSMVHSYKICAVWSSQDAEEGISMESVSEFSDSANLKAREDCESFLKECWKYGFLDFDSPDFDAGQIGHDFWLTRNHHGAGFWDRPELYNGQELADELTALAYSYGERSLWLNEDGEAEIE